MKICIIGAGWYGSHIARAARQAGHEVTLVDRNARIFQGVSGSRGIRLHSGPHYPRSVQTRQGCHVNSEKFSNTYPGLVIPHQYSVYGLGEEDANGAPSKVDEGQFDAVCQETTSEKITPAEWGYQHLISAFNVKEPSIAGGEHLCTEFEGYLKQAGVRVVCNFNVTKLERTSNGISVTDGNTTETFDFVVNSTCFENLLPNKPLPFDIEAVYQPCLALVYRDKLETVAKPPFSFIVMDGMYPCMMPYNERYVGPLKKDDKGDAYRVYMVTHGKWTIMASCDTFEKSQAVLHGITDEFVAQHIAPKCEADMTKFWPAFKNRFEYLGWTGSTLAKVKTAKEFRGAFSFCERDRPVAHVFPGKVGCIFSVGDEILTLLRNQQEDILEQDGYKFVKHGVLHEALGEMTEKPAANDDRNTCQLQTYTELLNADKTVNTPKAADMHEAAKSLMGIIRHNGHVLWASSSFTQGTLPVSALPVPASGQERSDDLLLSSR